MHPPFALGMLASAPPPTPLTVYLYSPTVLSRPPPTLMLPYRMKRGPTDICTRSRSPSLQRSLRSPSLLTPTPKTLTAHRSIWPGHHVPRPTPPPGTLVPLAAGPVAHLLLGRAGCSYIGRLGGYGTSWPPQPPPAVLSWGCGPCWGPGWAWEAARRSG